MTLKIAVGYSTKLIEAKERAIQFYNEAEGRKTFRAVETHQGYNETSESVWTTVIWFDIAEPIQQEPVYEFIGSTDIDPNDPNWRDKWNQETMTHIAE